MRTETEALYILRHQNQYSQIQISEAIRKIVSVNKHRLVKLNKIKKENEFLKAQLDEINKHNFPIIY